MKTFVLDASVALGSERSRDPGGHRRFRWLSFFLELRLAL
jgi:hypothetical protein